MSRTWHHRLKPKYNISTWEQNIVTDIDYLNSFEYILVNRLDELNIIDKQSLILKFIEFQENDYSIKKYLKKHKLNNDFNINLDYLEYAYTYYIFINPKSIKQYNIDDKIYQMIVFNYEFRNKLICYINIVNNHLIKSNKGNIEYNTYSSNSKPFKQSNDRVNRNHPKLDKDEILSKIERIENSCIPLFVVNAQHLSELLNVTTNEILEIIDDVNNDQDTLLEKLRKYIRQIAENYKEINYNVKSLNYDILCINRYDYYGEYIKYNNSTIIKQDKSKYHSKLGYTIQGIQVAISKRKSYDIKHKRRLRKQELINSKLNNTIEYQNEINIDKADIGIQRGSYKSSTNIKLKRLKNKNKSLSFNNILQLKNKIHNSPKVKEQVLQNRSDSKMYELFNYKYKRHSKEYYNIKTLNIQKQEALDEYIYQNNKILTREQNSAKQLFHNN